MPEPGPERGVPEPMPDAAGDRPTGKGIAVAVIVGCVLTVALAEGVLRFAMPHWREFYSGRFMRVVPVPDYGRVPTGRPGFDGYFAQNNGDFRVHIAINDFGLRNSEPVSAAEGRIWFVGDSMTFGWGVEDDQIYSAVAGRLAKARTYNVASPGTDVCGYQALVGRMPPDVRPRAVVVGLIVENDVHAYDCRKAAAAAGKAPGSPAPEVTLAGVKRFLTRHTALYNFFAVALKRVAFVNEALTAVGLVAESHDLRRTLAEADIERAVERTAAEIEALRRRLPARAAFAVLVAPARFEIRDDDPGFRALREKIAAALTLRGIAVIDPIERFREAGFGPTHFAHDGHWSPLGHAVAAFAVARWLRDQGIGG